MATSRRLALPASLQRWDVHLIGVVDGANLVFTTAEYFRNDGNHIRVHWNGFRLRGGIGNDYVVSESGGPGTGFNTVTLVEAPRAGDVLTADYVAT